MNIVILGGGTAGWLAAYGIAKALSHKHKITVVESSQIGIIGAGEGTTGIFSDFISGTFFPTNDIDIDEFIRETNATIKLGIHHVDWKGDGTSYMAPISLPLTGQQIPDNIFLHTLMINKNKLHLSAPTGLMYEFGVRVNRGVYQFDAVKVGEYFKKICSKHAKTSHIDATIASVNLSKNGSIKELVTDTGQIITGDFFIDCSGLKRVLMNKLDVAWHSYQTNLPVNAALPFQLPLEENYSQVTTAHALKNGWMWRIPTQTRYGCGYVYDDTHITPEQAQQEVEELLGHNISPIRNIKFTAGRGEVLWKKNCLSLGLSAAFAEPLEATSIHTTIAQLITFIFEYLQDTKEMTVVDSRINEYNRNMVRMYDDIKDFLVLHYQGGRTDSEFWRKITAKETTTDRVEEILNMCSHGLIPSIYTFNSSYLGMIGSGLHNWTLAGLDKITADHARTQLYKFNSFAQAKLETDQYLTDLSNQIQNSLKRQENI
jgi:tryptophan halogenase